MDRSERIEALKILFPPGWDDDGKLALDWAIGEAKTIRQLMTDDDEKTSAISRRLGERRARRVADAAMATAPGVGAILTAQITVALFIRSGLPVPQPLRTFAEKAVTGYGPSAGTRLEAECKRFRDGWYAYAADEALQFGAPSREAAYGEVAEAANGSDSVSHIKRCVTRYHRERKAKMASLAAMLPKYGMSVEDLGPDPWL